MKTGVIVLGMDSGLPDGKRIAEKCAGYLVSAGRKNVRTAYHRGEPSSDAVMLDMFHQGVDTFAILPLTVSEGKLTVWEMPGKLRLPDNSGSWTILEGKDVATRFATALGRDPRMAEALAEREGNPADDTGLLLAAWGSPHSQCRKTAEYYAGCLRDRGWAAEFGFTGMGVPSVLEAAEKLREQGALRIRIIPLMISADSPSLSGAFRNLVSLGFDAEMAEPISHIPVFMEILDSKVPEKW